MKKKSHRRFLRTLDVYIARDIDRVQLERRVGFPLGNRRFCDVDRIPWVHQICCVFSLELAEAWLATGRPRRPEACQGRVLLRGFGCRLRTTTKAPPDHWGQNGATGTYNSNITFDGGPDHDHHIIPGRILNLKRGVGVDPDDTDDRCTTQETISFRSGLQSQDE